MLSSQHYFYRHCQRSTLRKVLYKVCMMPQQCCHLPDWASASSSSTSPTTSSEAFNLSPAYAHPALPEAFTNYFQDPSYNMTSFETEESALSSRRTRCRIMGPQRQSASEREKMRMRNLSKALHNLRRYLPPSLVPAGRNLTKIETLRMTIHYISYLSQLLGLNEETMRQRRNPKPEMYIHNPYAKMIQGCQETTPTHYDPIQEQSQGLLQHQVPHQCPKARTSPVEREHLHIENGQWMQHTLCHKMSSAVTDLTLPSSHCSRLSHLYQVADCCYPDQRTTHLQPMKQFNSSPQSTDEGLTFINGL